MRFCLQVRCRWALRPPLVFGQQATRRAGCVPEGWRGFTAQRVGWWQPHLLPEIIVMSQDCLDWHPSISVLN